MGKFDYRTLTPDERAQLVDELVEVFSAFEKKDDLRDFLRRLLTQSELFMLARRLRVAEGLVQGKSYATIREELGVGLSTIQSVDGWLEHAVRDYHEFRQQRSKRKKKNKHAPEPTGDIVGTFGDIRHRYSGAFWLLNLILDPQQRPDEEDVEDRAGKGREGEEGRE